MPVANPTAAMRNNGVPRSFVSISRT
jgi:hypothetical protein